uniref:ribosomal protein L24 n=1 Tax=Polyopes affinis TaxID=194519 RepID=UPI002A808C00|nr:ribosomal protein L24 [Polyopes affinis]WOL37058.1 ribosomal protein L24 [Polyopes affinis]
MIKKNISKKYKIHLKTGDIVKIISGKNKGKKGEIKKIISKTRKILVKDINLMTRHLKPKKEGETGQIIKIEAPIHSSNVILCNDT